MKQAVILAAGEGLRLKPFTVSRPKVMLNVAGKPIIQYVLESLAENNIRDIVVIVGYQKEQLFDYIGDGKQFGVEAKFVFQTKQLGTAHALAQAEDMVKDEFLVIPGDKLISPGTLAQIVDVKGMAILVKQEDKPSRNGIVTAADGYLKFISEKPKNNGDNLINTGIYALTKEIFTSLNSTLDIPDVLNELALNRKPIKVIETDCTWLNILYPWDILDLNSTIIRQIDAGQHGIIEPGVLLKGDVSIGKDTIVRANSYIVGPVVIGNGCNIGPNTCIFPSTSIANNVVISPFTEVTNSVIGDDVHIGSSSIIQDSVIDKGCVIGSHFNACSDVADVRVDTENHIIKIGAMVGKSCHLGSMVTVEPGTIIGNYCQVKPLKLLNGRLPDRSMVV